MVGIQRMYIMKTKVESIVSTSYVVLVVTASVVRNDGWCFTFAVTQPIHLSHELASTCHFSPKVF